MRLRSLRSGTRYRTAIALAAAAVIGLFSGGCAQKTRVYRVGILAGLAPIYNIADGFMAGMKDLGYVEGKTIVYDLHKTNNDPAAEKPILRKFVADKMDLIFVFPTEEVFLAEEAVRETKIPVVFAQTNIEGTGLVESVSRPGGNVTGVRYAGPDLAVKRLEILHDLVPKARRIWVPFQKGAQVVLPQLEMLRPAARRLGVTLVEAPFATTDDLLADLEKRAKAADIGFDAILLIVEQLVKSPQTYPRLDELVTARKIPIGGVLNPQPGYSTLFGVASDNLKMGKLAAQQADKVLKGTPAGAVPVTSGESFFQLNYRMALQQKITVPDTLIKQADDIIK